MVVVNKVDRAERAQVTAQLAAAAELDAEAYFPVSAKTGAGLDVLVDYLAERMPEGPPLFPEATVRDACRMSNGSPSWCAATAGGDA